MRSRDVPDRLRVSVLGPVRAWAGEREIDLGPARQRALFAVLAARGGRVVGRDELIEAVWGTAAPVTAAGSIYTYISGLRRGLDSERSRLASGPTGDAPPLGTGDLHADADPRLCAPAPHPPHPRGAAGGGAPAGGGPG